MLDLNYLIGVAKRKTTGTVTTGIEGLTDDSQFMESAAGYDGIVEMMQHKGRQVCMVLEHDTKGDFFILPGGFQERTQTVWIMEMVGFDSDRTAIQQRCFDRMKHLIGIFLKRRTAGDAALQGWTPEARKEAISWMCHNAGPNYTGYEVCFRFREDIDLSDDGSIYG